MKILPRSTQSARRLVLFFLALFAVLAVSLFSEQDRHLPRATHSLIAGWRQAPVWYNKALVLSRCRGMIRADGGRDHAKIADWGTGIYAAAGTQ